MLIHVRKVVVGGRMYVVGDPKAPGLNGGRANISKVLVEDRGGVFYYEVWFTENGIEHLWRNGLDIAVHAEYDVREGREA